MNSQYIPPRNLYLFSLMNITMYHRKKTLHLNAKPLKRFSLSLSEKHTYFSLWANQLKQVYQKKRVFTSKEVFSVIIQHDFCWLWTTGVCAEVFCRKTCWLWRWRTWLHIKKKKKLNNYQRTIYHVSVSKNYCNKHSFITKKKDKTYRKETLSAISISYSQHCNNEQRVGASQ